MAHAAWDLGREAHWRTVVARWRRSGRSVREFCRAEGIGEHSFYVWRRKLGQVEPQAPVFLPVHVVADEAQHPTAGIEVVLANGRCLRVAPGFDPQTLIQVVALLEAGGAAC